MTIATLLFVTTVIKITGGTGQVYMNKAIVIGGVVCVAIAVAGGVAQSLKTTFIIGGTPRKVQVGMFLALAVAAVFSALVINMLNTAYGIGSDAVPAPQATLMSMIVEGIMTAKLPWTLVGSGAAIALFCELAGLSILPVALGIYLPITLNATIFIGGCIREIVERKFAKQKERKAEVVEKGTLLASGLVAGDALMGIVVAAFATFNINIAFGKNFLTGITQSNLFACVMFLLLGLWIYMFACKKDKIVK